MNYIKIDVDDISFVNNQTVICWDETSGYVVFEPLPESLQDYFKNHERFKFIDKPDWKYFLIPLDLVPYISHYSDFVKEAYPELIFDIIVENRTLQVEGADVVIPHKQIKVIPCSCTRWSDEGLELLDAVIENWNVTYPDKQINFQVAFESFEEFENFRNEHIIIA